MILLNKIYFHAKMWWYVKLPFVVCVCVCVWNQFHVSRVDWYNINIENNNKSRRMIFEVKFLLCFSKNFERNINHVYEMKIRGISRIEIDRERLFFYVENKWTPTRTTGIANKMRFFSFGWDTSFGFMFLPLFVYSTFERNRPSFHSRWTYKPENGKRWTWILEKDFRPPVYSYKGFLFSFTLNMYVFLCESGTDKSYRVSAKIANI